MVNYSSNQTNVDVTPPPKQCLMVEKELTELNLHLEGQTEVDNRVNMNQLLRPVLCGKLQREENGKVIWSGEWGLTRERLLSFEQLAKEDIKKQPFRFERVAIVGDTGSPSSSDRPPECRDGHFKGYFCMERKLEKGGTMIAKYYEKDLLLRFSSNDDVDNNSRYEITGSGENKFGKFLVEGVYEPKSNIMSCVRNYIPKSIYASPMKTRRKSKTDSTVSQLQNAVEDMDLKNDKRAKRPSERLKEFVINFKEMTRTLKAPVPKKRKISSAPTSPKPLTPCSIMGGRKLVNRCSSYFTQNSDSIYSLLCSTTAHSRSKTEKECGATADAVEEDPFQQNLASTIKDIDFQFEDFEFDGFDPLADDVCAKLPKSMRRIPSISLEKTFDLQHFPEVNNLSVISGEAAKNNAFDELPLSFEESFELKTLDAKTIRELNDTLEFSCPSKGG